MTNKILVLYLRVSENVRVEQNAWRKRLLLRRRWGK